MILSLTAHDTDASVRSAGERVVAHLIDGTLSECDVEAVGEEFVNGGALQAAVTQARALIAKKRVCQCGKLRSLCLKQHRHRTHLRRQ